MRKILGLTAFLLFAEWASGQALLRVRPHVVVAPNSKVKLSALVDGQGLSRRLMDKMAGITLTVAPAYGERQELSETELTPILRPLIQDERAHSKLGLQVVIPQTVIVDTAKHDLDADLVQTELLQTWGPLCGDCQLSVEGLSLPRVDGVRDWSLRLKSELPRGSFSVPVDLVRENRAPLTAWISGRLVVKRKVPVALRSLQIGERVLPKDFSWQYRDTSYALDGAPAAEDVLGKRLKQGLRAGDILWNGMLERERAVRAGDLVQLKSSEGVWEVSISAIAQQDAFVGDTIHLKNPSTNAVLMGQVTGRDEAELR